MIRADNIFIAQGKILEGAEQLVKPQASSSLRHYRPFPSVVTFPFGGTYRQPHSKYLTCAQSQPGDGRSGLTVDVNTSKDCQPSSRTTASNKRRSARPSNRGSSRRGFDVLDELMYSQGRSSNALLEKLQSSVASENGDNFSEISLSPRRGTVSTKNGVDMKEGVVAQRRSSARGKDASKSLHEAPTEDAPASSTFASSIGKALSTNSDAKSNILGGSISGHPTSLQEGISGQALGGEASDTEKPSLRGQEVLWALQKAAFEKKKAIKKPRKLPSSTSKSKETSSLQDFGDWRNAKPITVKPEWAMQIDELERRIEELKNPMRPLRSS